MKKEESNKVTTKDEMTKSAKYKSITIASLLGEKKNSKKVTEKSEKNNKKQESNNNEIKDPRSISLSAIIDNIQNMPEKALEKEIENIKEDIKNFNLKIGIDKSAIKIISGLEKNPNKEIIEKLLGSFTQTMSIDVDSMADLSTDQLKSVRNYCKVDKVYINSGWDVAAKEGYDVNKYTQIRTQADKLLNSALKGLPKDASEEQKFKAIYKAIIKAERYDRQALNTDAPDYEKRRIVSRNLEGFFIKRKTVCAGTAEALKQVAEMAGFEMEYVQGNAQSKWDIRNNEGPYYHAWVKVKIGDKWFNADPTWDANHAGKPYEYFLKSDKDFKGHTEDRQYNPTYRRNEKQTSRSQRQYTTSERAYKNAEQSISRNIIKQEDYRIFNEKRKQIAYEESQLTEEQRKELYYKATEKDYERLNEEYSPYKVLTKMTFKQRIVKFFNKFKAFINKNKDGKSVKQIVKDTQSKSDSKISKYQLNPKKYNLTPEQAKARVRAVEQNIRTATKDGEKTR